MTKQQDKTLAEKYSWKDLAESYVFPAEISKEDRKESTTLLNGILKNRRAAMTGKEQLMAQMLQLRFEIEDYLNNSDYDKDKTFGYFLSTYIDLLKKRRNEFSQEININPTELSQYINNHRKPPQNIMIRLELHSHNILPAVDWYRLVEKETVYKLGNNKAIRKEEKKFIVKEAQLN